MGQKNLSDFHDSLTKHAHSVFMEFPKVFLKNPTYYINMKNLRDFLDSLTKCSRSVFMELPKVFLKYPRYKYEISILKKTLGISTIH